MDIETFRNHCMAINGAAESLPFLHHNVIVFKVMGKMFAMASLEPKDGIFWADLKCNPELTLDLRERYNGIVSGHVKKTILWNRVILESDVPDELIVRLIRHSVQEVLDKLPKSKRVQYENMSVNKDDILPGVYKRNNDILL